MPEDGTLFERLGGQEAIDAVVDDFYDRVLSDEDLQPYFRETDTGELREHQKQFLAAVAGGPVEYDGTDMATAHAHLDVTDEAFTRVAEHLSATLESFDVPEEERSEVMDAVASYRDDVVTP